jgi:hypothetical protein
MGRKKQVVLTPEAGASQLLAELREENRRGREILADNKMVLRQIKEERERAKEERERIERLLREIPEELRHFVEEIMKREVTNGTVAINAAVEGARDQIVARLKEMTAALLGVPVEVFETGPFKFTSLMEEVKLSTLKP